MLVSSAMALGLIGVVFADTPWLDVPYVTQVDAGCGAASIAMVMQYWVREDRSLDAASSDVDRILRQLPPDPKRGISGEALRRYLEQNGFRAFTFNGELADLRKHLDKGRPVVACLAPRGPRAPLHYVVVVGLSSTSVLLHDPARGKLIEENLERFERDWKATENWTLLAVPGASPGAADIAPDRPAGPADTELSQGLALARAGRFEEAERVLLEARRSNPRDSRFSLELAGIAYRANNSAAAKNRLRSALKLDPSSEYGNDFLATLYFIEGNLPAALKYWNRIGKPLLQDFRVTPAPDLDPLLRDRALAISGGQVFTLDRLRRMEANLKRLGVFGNHRFELKPRAAGGDSRFDLTFHAIEKTQPVGGKLGRILPYVRGLLFETVYADFDNIGQRAIQWRSMWRWDPDKQRIRMSLSGPVRRDPRWKYRFTADARDEFWNLSETFFGEPGRIEELRLRKVEAGVESEYGITGRLTWTSSASLARRGFANGGDSQVFADSWSFALRNAMTYRLWDLPEHRFRADSSAILRTGRVLTGAPSRFATVEGDLNAIWFPQAKGDDLEVDGRFRVGNTFGELPFDEFFSLGMERDQGLWMRGHAGSRGGRKGAAPMGTRYALMQTTLQRTVFKFSLARIQAGPFFDLGRIAHPSGLFGSRGWMYDTGVEARLKARGVSFSVVYGRDLRDGRNVLYAGVSLGSVM